jgi:hypothetical protein
MHIVPVKILLKRAMLEISHNLAMFLMLAIMLVVGTMIWLAGLAMSLLLAMLSMLVLEQVLLGDFMDTPMLWAQELLPPICTIVATTTKNASWPTKQVFRVNANPQR